MLARGPDFAAEHAGDFLNAIVGGQLLDIRFRPSIDHGFAHHVMRLRRGGDGGEVGDAEYLPLVGDLPHALANGVGGFATDIGVNFIENQNGDGILGGQHGLESNITRASSPEEAMARSGRAGSPGLGAN